MTLAEALAAEVAANRADINISQKQAAKRAGISVAWLQRIESGRIEPSIRSLVRLERAIQATPDQVVHRALVRMRGAR